MQTVKCIDNSGASATYGPIDKIITVGEEVELLAVIGCCYIVRNNQGEEFTLNQSRFE